MTSDPGNGDIFQMLSHPYRKQILRLLTARSRMYTELMEELGIESGKLRFHLEKLRPALSQDEQKRYYLSDFGRQALEILENVESPDRTVKKEGKKNPHQLGFAIIAGIVIGILIGISLVEVDEGTVTPTTPANISGDDKPRFLPEFEMGVYGVPEILTTNQTKRARIEVRNAGDVAIKNLTLLIKTTPQQEYFIGDFMGEGMSFTGTDEGTLVSIGTLHTTPTDIKIIEFTLNARDYMVDHSLEIDVFFYPRNKWSTIYKKDIYVSPRTIHVQ